MRPGVGALSPRAHDENCYPALAARPSVFGTGGAASTG